MHITPDLGDGLILEELGRRVERHRLEANLTQASLAREAGVSKRTLERLEATGACQLASLVRVLRALNLLQHLEVALPAPSPGPMSLLRNEGRVRQRASTPRSPASGAADAVAQGEPWEWDAPTPRPSDKPDS